MATLAAQFGRYAASALSHFYHGSVVAAPPLPRLLHSKEDIVAEINDLHRIADMIYRHYDTKAVLYAFSSLSNETKETLYFSVWLNDGCPKITDYGKNTVNADPHRLRSDLPFLAPDRGDLLHQMIHVLEHRRDHAPLQELQKAAYRKILTNPHLSHEVKERCYLKLDFKSRSEVEAPVRGLLHQELGSFYFAKDRCTLFSVQAPSAKHVNVVMTYEGRDTRKIEMRRNAHLGYWEAFGDDVHPGATYHYEIITHDGRAFKKIDPFASEQRASHTDYFHYESVVRDPSSMGWTDGDWMARRKEAVGKSLPMNAININVLSWNPDIKSYAKLAEEIAAHCEHMGYTHVVLSGLLEHPNEGSRGYQPLTLCAPTSRLGSIHDFQHLVNFLHHKNIGVGVDFVPDHFATDHFGLGSYDGGHLFEHERPAYAWDAIKFNYENAFTRNYAISSAKFWADMHVDFFRVDAVDPLVDFPHAENPAALYFIRTLNEYLHQSHPGVLTFAESSKYSSAITRPTSEGGYGFNAQMDMGRQHDFQRYLREDFPHRGDHHEELVRAPFAIAGTAVCTLSHDQDIRPDVMPGDPWRKFANSRILRCLQMLTPGIKATYVPRQWESGDHLPQGLFKTVRALNHLYRRHASLWESNETSALKWIDTKDRVNSVVSFHRGNLACVFNMKPDCIAKYDIYFPDGEDRSRISSMREVFSSDAADFGGSGKTNPFVTLIKSGDRTIGFTIQLPPLACAVFEESFS